MSSKPQRSLRLEKRSARSLAVLSGAPGEIFFDNDNGTLRVYTDTTGNSIILANRQWVSDNTFSGDFNDLINKPTIPTVLSQLSNDTNFVTQAQVDEALANIDSGQIDLTGYATETYVDTAISNIDTSNIASLDNIGDVAYSGTPQTNEVLTWNGTNWVNSLSQVDLSSYYTSTQTDTAISTAISNFQTTIVDAAPAALDTLNELAAALGDDANFATTVTNSLSGKQATLVSGTNIKTVNSTSLLGSGDLAVQATLVSGTNIKTVNNNSLLGSGNISVQDALVSGTNIKTVNSTSLLGSGDLAVQATLVSGTNIKTVNGTSILGSGDLTIATGNPFNQDLNTTNDVEFNSVTTGNFISNGVGAPSIDSATTITLTAPDGITFTDNTNSITFLTSSGKGIDLDTASGDSYIKLDTASGWNGVYYANNGSLKWVSYVNSTDLTNYRIRYIGGNDLLTLSSNGNLTLVGTVNLPNNGLIQWNGTGAFVQGSSTAATIGSPTGGQVTVSNDYITLAGAPVVFERPAVERTATNPSISGGVEIHNLSAGGGLFYATTPTANWTANFTNVITLNEYTTSVAIIIEQGTTAYMPTAVQIDGAAQTILWQGGSAPTGTANGIDVVSFSLIRIANGWKVIGSATSYS